MLRYSESFKKADSDITSQTTVTYRAANLKKFSNERTTTKYTDTPTGKSKLYTTVNVNSPNGKSTPANLRV